MVQPVEVSVDADVLPDLQNVGDGLHELHLLVSDRFGRSRDFTSIAVFGEHLLHVGGIQVYAPPSSNLF